MRGHTDVVGELDALTGGDGGDKVAEAPQALGWSKRCQRVARVGWMVVDGGGGRGRRPAASLPPPLAPATHPPGGLVSSKRVAANSAQVATESVLGEVWIEVLKAWPKASSESYGLRIRTSDSVSGPSGVAVAARYYDTLI
jgi:hypothetical protein